MHDSPPDPSDQDSLARPLGLHHLALGARDVERVATFYSQVFLLPEVARHHTPAGTLRSIWLSLGQGVLMVELATAERPLVTGVGGGIFLLSFAVHAAARATWEGKLEAAGSVIESRTAHTSYARDPEGNRVALSSYPLGQ